MLRLKPDEMKEIEHFAKETEIGQVLSEMKKWGFEVGDVLIRRETDLNGVSNIDMVNGTDTVPKKFKVVHVDDLGVPWIKAISVRGGLGNKLYCLALQDTERYKYQVDPEQLDALLLGYPYDPRVEYKRMRDSNPNYGSKDKDK